MSVRIDIDGDDVVVRVDGLDVLWTLAREIRIARRDVVDARVAAISTLKRELGWRVGGGYFPGALATGWFTWRGRRGLRQWWCTYRDDEVLVIDTAVERPARVVVQTPDRERLARELNA